MQLTLSLRTMCSDLWHSANPTSKDRSTNTEPPLLTHVVSSGFRPMAPALRLIKQSNEEIARPASFVAAWTRLLGIEVPVPEPPVLTHVVSRGVLPVAIQLKTTLRVIEPSTLPQLDVIHRYELYTSEHKSQGRVWHRLRLGFFPDVASACAVLSQLKRHFRDARVVGVSSPEREALLSGHGPSRFLA